MTNLAVVPEVEPTQPAPIVLYTTEQLAELLNVSRHAIHQMSSDGELPPAIKIGRRVRYDADDVREWLNSKKDKG